MKETIYDEKVCPISLEKIEDISDPVVFNHRVYSKACLLDWYVTQFRDGHAELKDLVSQKVLPPVKNTGGLFSQVLRYTPHFTRKERVLMYQTMMVTSSFIGRRMRNMSPTYMSEDTLVTLSWIKCGMISVASLLLLVDATRLLLEKKAQHVEKTKGIINDWLSEQTQVYDPSIHKVRTKQNATGTSDDHQQNQQQGRSNAP